MAQKSSCWWFGATCALFVVACIAVGSALFTTGCPPAALRSTGKTCTDAAHVHAHAGVVQNTTTWSHTCTRCTKNADVCTVVSAGGTGTAHRTKLVCSNQCVEWASFECWDAGYEVAVQPWGVCTVSDACVGLPSAAAARSCLDTLAVRNGTLVRVYVDSSRQLLQCSFKRFGASRAAAIAGFVLLMVPAALFVCVFVAGVCVAVSYCCLSCELFTDAARAVVNKPLAAAAPAAIEAAGPVRFV